MILLSNIIKAEYVLYEKNEQLEKTVCTYINNSKEELYEIYNQREVIIKEATEESVRIINIAKRNAQSQIEHSKNKGYEEGYNAGIEAAKINGYKDGYENGFNKANEELNLKTEAKIKEINDILEEIENQKHNIISKFKEEISKLSIDIAEKIIREKVDSDDYIITNIIEHSIKNYKNSEWIKIYISEKDDAIKIQADKNLVHELRNISENVKFEILKDSEKGTLIIETPDNIIDAGIDTQLNNLKEIVLNK